MAERFGELSEIEIQTLVDNSTPKCTEKATKFGMKVFDGRLKLHFKILCFYLDVFSFNGTKTTIKFLSTMKVSQKKLFFLPLHL